MNNVTYAEATDLYYNFRLWCKNQSTDLDDELFINQMCQIFGELMTGTFTPDMIKQVIINRINTPSK